MSGEKKAIDWEEVRERLRHNERALEKALVPDRQRLEAVYRERAARLARRQERPQGRQGGRLGEPAGAASAVTPVLVFRLRAERYAIPLPDVAEVVTGADCTPVPGAPPPLAGVINLRGEIRPVWDLARLLQLPESDHSSSQCVLMLRRPGRVVGLRVDRAEQIRLLRPEEYNQTAEQALYLRGVTADTLMILNTEALLKEELCG